MTTNPIYAAAYAARERGARSAEYIGFADTAKLIRAELAKHWPAVRFYVRSQSYAGGASIHVYYDGIRSYQPLDACYCRDAGPTVREHDSNRCTECGYVGRLQPIYAPGAPTRDEVDAIVDPFESRGFDGSIDLSYYREAWLAPDGSVSFGHTSGTEGSRGYVPSRDGTRHHASALLVSFGTSYVFVEPELPYDVRQKARATVSA